MSDKQFLRSVNQSARLYRTVTVQRFPLYCNCNCKSKFSKTAIKYCTSTVTVFFKCISAFESLFQYLLDLKSIKLMFLYPQMAVMNRPRTNLASTRVGRAKDRRFNILFS